MTKSVDNCGKDIWSQDYGNIHLWQNQLSESPDIGPPLSKKSFPVSRVGDKKKPVGRSRIFFFPLISFFIK